MVWVHLYSIHADPHYLTEVHVGPTLYCNHGSFTRTKNLFSEDNIVPTRELTVNNYKAQD